MKIPMILLGMLLVVTSYGAGMVQGYTVRGQVDGAIDKVPLIGWMK